MNRSMTPYIASETAISIVINVVISIGFVFATFHGLARVPPSGPGGLIRDAVPQTFAISLMGVLVPTLLTRRRGRAGNLPAPRSPRQIQPWHVLLRALMFAVLGTCVGIVANYGLFGQATVGLTFRWVLVFKAVYGGLVALMVTPVAVILALHDVAARRSTSS